MGTLFQTTLTLSPEVIFSLCFVSYFGGSLSTFMMKIETKDKPSMGLFQVVSFPVILRPPPVTAALVMSSPTFSWETDQCQPWDQGRQGTCFPTSVPQAYNSDFLEAEPRQHSKGSCCGMNPDAERLKTFAPVFL